MTLPFEPRIPTGRTSDIWFSEGYQSAMIDIRTQLERGGEGAVREWIKNNMRAAR